MDEQNSGFILCDISFNGQLIADVKLPRACSMGNIVQGLWLDDNFRKTGLAYLKAKDEEAQKMDGESATPLKCFHGIDRSILRAYVAIRIMPAWKWLEFKDFIVDFENKKDCYTVGDVLGTLCTGLHKPVLRIVPKSENEADDQEVKNIVNELLKTRSLATLAAADCPLSNGMLSLIAQGKYTSTIGHDKCQGFIHWLRRQDLTNDSLASSEKRVETPKPKLPMLTPPASKSTKPRITFSQNEIDTLTEWFNEDERPTREIIIQYTDILNIPREVASMRLLTSESVYFWFKNKRSKRKKEEASLLEPWEQVEEHKVQESSQATVATGGTPQLTMRSTPQGSEDLGERGKNSGDISMEITKNSNEVSIPNGLATMLVRYTQDGRQLDFRQSPSKPRKIPKSRVTFDPQTELSSLNTWFDENDRPTKEIVEEYTNILNMARSEKSKRMLTADSIAMWFKNKRSKRRRGEANIVYSGENGEQQIVQAMEEDEKTVLSNDEKMVLSNDGSPTLVSAGANVTTNFEVNVATAAGVAIVSASTNDTIASDNMQTENDSKAITTVIAM